MGLFGRKKPDETERDSAAAIRELQRRNIVNAVRARQILSEVKRIERLAKEMASEDPLDTVS